MQVPTLGAGATNGAALYNKTFSGDSWSYGNMTYNSTQVRDEHDFAARLSVLPRFSMSRAQ